MRRSWRALALIPLLGASIAWGANADERDDAYRYYGEYHLKSESPMARYLGLDRLRVKKLASRHTPLLLTLNNGRRFREMNIPVRFSGFRKGFLFEVETLTWCEDYDCAGLANAKGEFRRGTETFREELHVTFGFYRDEDGQTVREWTEDLRYVSTPHDGSYDW